jgi:TRAP-type mannitol/chloroaromatic compound transport system substrate-binding protein
LTDRTRRHVWLGFWIGLASLVGPLGLLAESQHPPKALAQAPTALKIQASWPASLTLYENLQMFADRVAKLSGGRLKVETIPAGTIVPAFEVLDATDKKVIDGAHTWAGYWRAKHKAAILFTGGPGGTFGMDYIDYLGWMYEGGGFELYQQWYKDVLKYDVVSLPILPVGPQAFGWFKRPIKNLADLKGMKCLQTGVAAEVSVEMGMRPVNMPSGEIIPAARRGVIDCAEWVGGVEDLRLGLHNVWKYHYAPGMAENVTTGELLINGDIWRRLPPDLQEIVKSAATETFVRWWAWWQKENAHATKELQEKHRVQILKTPDDILIEVLKAWDRIAAREAEKDPFFKKVLESQRQYAALVVPAKRLLFPPYEFAANYYWPVKSAPAAVPVRPAVPAKK